MIEPPRPDDLRIFIRMANEDYPYFKEEAEPRLAELASARIKRGTTLYSQDVTPRDLEGLIYPDVDDPIQALQVVIERAHFLRRCLKDMDVLPPTRTESASSLHWIYDFAHSAPQLAPASG